MQSSWSYLVLNYRNIGTHLIKVTYSALSEIIKVCVIRAIDIRSFIEYWIQSEWTNSSKATEQLFLKFCTTVIETSNVGFWNRISFDNFINVKCFLFYE